MSARSRSRSHLFAVFSGILVAAANAWILWCAYVGFTGGSLPIPGMEISAAGGLRSGVMFLVFGVPIASWVAFLVAKAIYLPLALLLSAMGVTTRHGKSGTE